ncbi:TPA: hypothetical protein ACUMWI_000837 [Haemophilus influenzae]|uniref:hypothetical protein n=1 Tax=Haemophilus influenzae TaxID=727 RepID=UPI0015E39500|nr:hypothetical protein [Haemophilus influenzae]MCK8792981.1 hypothetical protein [Haemophilus influenzae]MCK8847958.1 hypothetical protein [Haemophilus influenzae]BBF10762.1 hypothetical protein CHBNIV1_11230 [Haemophilus influenzae]
MTGKTHSDFTPPLARTRVLVAKLNKKGSMHYIKPFYIGVTGGLIRFAIRRFLPFNALNIEPVNLLCHFRKLMD